MTHIIGVKLSLWYQGVELLFFQTLWLYLIPIHKNTLVNTTTARTWSILPVAPWPPLFDPAVGLQYSQSDLQDEWRLQNHPWYSNKKFYFYCSIYFTRTILNKVSRKRIIFNGIFFCGLQLNAVQLIFNCCTYIAQSY